MKAPALADVVDKVRSPPGWRGAGRQSTPGVSGVIVLVNDGIGLLDYLCV